MMGVDVVEKITSTPIFFYKYIWDSDSLSITHLVLYKVKPPVHHIDYDKKNCVSNNLITLCIPCHMKTNYNRSYWQQRLQKYQTERNII